jgi:hypothetical protein
MRVLPDNKGSGSVRTLGLKDDMRGDVERNLWKRAMGSSLGVYSTLALSGVLKTCGWTIQNSVYTKVGI